MHTSSTSVEWFARVHPIKGLVFNKAEEERNLREGEGKKANERGGRGGGGHIHDDDDTDDGVDGGDYDSHKRTRIHPHTSTHAHTEGGLRSLERPLNAI